MCGRCVTLTFDEVLGIVLAIESGAPIDFASEWPARGPEAFPKSLAPLIVPNFDTARQTPSLTTGALSVRDLSWGFEESWKPGVVFNTRIESAMKPTWRESIEHRRCIIPVSTFYETHRSETTPSPRTGKPIKRAYEFHVPDERIMLVGCIWRDQSFSMVTTDANSYMAHIHPRMPLIVRRDELSIWFGPDYRSLADRSTIRLEATPR